MKTMLCTALALALAVPLAQAQDKAGARSGAMADAKPAAARTAYPDTSWDELVPPDWDPLKQFKDMNFGVLGDADPKAAAMLKKMREVWDNAPVNNKMDGKAIRIPGYIVPLEEGKKGMTEFLLVPYFGACIHSPPPPANQIIHVKPKEPAKGIKSMDAVWVQGTIHTLRSDTFMGASSYRMEAQGIERYVEKPAK